MWKHVKKTKWKQCEAMWENMWGNVKTMWNTCETNVKTKMWNTNVKRNVKRQCENKRLNGNWKTCGNPQRKHWKTKCENCENCVNIWKTMWNMCGKCEKRFNVGYRPRACWVILEMWVNLDICQYYFVVLICRATSKQCSAKR